MTPWVFLLAALSMSGQSSSDSLIKQNFKDDASGWVAIGTAAKVSVTHQGPIAPVGLGALQFDYKIEKGEMDILLLPTEVGSLAKAKSFKFRVMADTNAPLAVILQEKDGGRYVAFCLAAKNSWQACELSPSDFHLAQEASDPKDPDGKLDMDQVNNIGVIDLDEIFGGSDNADINRLLHVEKGSHTLFVERFSVETEPVPLTSSKTNGVASVDTFCHPQLAWMGIGDIKMSVAADSSLTGPALKWTYRQEPNSFVGATLGIDPGLFSGADSLSFDLASVRGGTMRVQIEEIGGIKFSTSVDIPFESKPKHVVLHFSDFRSTDDSADPNAKLDLSKVKTLLLTDQSGILAQADPDHPDNTLWINHIQASSAK